MVGIDTLEKYLKYDGIAIYSPPLDFEWIYENSVAKNNEKKMIADSNKTWLSFDQSVLQSYTREAFLQCSLWEHS